MLMAVQVKPYWVLLPSALRGDGVGHTVVEPAFLPFLHSCAALLSEFSLRTSPGLWKEAARNLSLFLPCTLVLSTSV